MALSDEALAARALIDQDANDRRMAVWDGRRPVGPGARSIGSLALVTPGMAVWTDPERKRGPHDDALGGFVLEITSRQLEDLETGEISAVRSFRCYDPIAEFPARAFRTFAEDLIPRSGVEAVETSQLRTAARRFARHFGAGRGPFTTFDERLVADAHRLVVVAMGGPS